MCRSKPPKMVVTGSEMKIKLVVGYYLNTKFSKKIARFLFKFGQKNIIISIHV